MLITAFQPVHKNGIRFFTKILMPLMPVIIPDTLLYDVNNALALQPMLKIGHKLPVLTNTRSMKVLK